jgi:hypothetical protein
VGGLSPAGGGACKAGVEVATYVNKTPAEVEASAGVYTRYRLSNYCFTNFPAYLPTFTT